MLCGALYPGRYPGYWKSTPQVSGLVKFKFGTAENHWEQQGYSNSTLQVSGLVEFMFGTAENSENNNFILALDVFPTKLEKISHPKYDLLSGRIN